MAALIAQDYEPDRFDLRAGDTLLGLAIVPTEVYGPRRRAEFLLTNAVDAEDYPRVRALLPPEPPTCERNVSPSVVRRPPRQASFVAPA